MPPPTSCSAGNGDIPRFLANGDSLVWRIECRAASRTFFSLNSGALREFPDGNSRRSLVVRCAPLHLQNWPVGYATQRRAAALSSPPSIRSKSVRDAARHPTVIVGRRGSRNHKLTPAEKQVNNLLAAERAGNEHAHAHLKNWRGTTRLRHGWMRDHATTLSRALLVLTNTEINR